MKARVIPLLHPAAISRGQFAKEPAQLLYMKRSVQALKGEREWPDWNINEPPPNTKLFPTIKDLDEFYYELPEPYDAVAIDIENAGPHLICIGLCQLVLQDSTIGNTVVVRFRRRGGVLYYPRKNDLALVVAWLGSLLADVSVAKVFHNGITYDVPALEQIGFEVKGRLIDTILLAHIAFSELPKSLQFLSTLKLWAPTWKLLIEESEEDEAKA